MSIPPAPDSPDTPLVPPAPEQVVADPYEKRYNDLRPKFDQTAQEAAELRAFKESLTSDPEALHAFLAEQGYEVEDPDPPAYDSAAEERLARIEEMLTARQEAEAQAASEQAEQSRIAALEGLIEQQMTSVAALAGVEKLDAKTRGWLESRALYGLPPREDGAPDIEGAYSELMEWRKSDDSVWAQTKNAPRPPGNGKPGVQAPDLDDGEARRAWMRQQLSMAQ